MLTRALSSLRMALAATPVVDVLKSIWDAPRTRALKDSLLGMRESEAIGLDAMGDEDAIASLVFKGRERLAMRLQYALYRVPNWSTLTSSIHDLRPRAYQVQAG